MKSTASEPGLRKEIEINIVLALSNLSNIAQHVKALKTRMIGSETWCFRCFINMV